MRPICQENLKKQKEAKAAITYGKRACNTIMFLCRKHQAYPILLEYVTGKSLEEMDINVIMTYRSDLLIHITDHVVDYFESVIGLPEITLRLRVLRALYDLEQALEEIKECKNNA